MQPEGSPANDVTQLLRAWNAGDADAFERLVPLVYDELHRMALRYLAGERATVSLQPTALVNEVCIRLLGWDGVKWQSRGHFFGVSAQMMRRVLVDIARRRRADRRGGPDLVRVPLDGIDVAAASPDVDLVAIDLALEGLAAEDERKARVVELRFFGGLSIEETAEALGVSARTVQMDWAFARAWLYQRLTEGTGP
jgi:RNA polymerase sigma-70 factor (ECF subfamily)